MITCNDCVHHDICYKIEHFGRDLETDKACEQFGGNGKWISAAYRLPDRNCNCLVYYESTDKRVGYGSYNPNDGRWTVCNIFNGHFIYFNLEKVLYWMPLPEPPDRDDD